MDAIEFVKEFGLDTTKQAVYRDTAPYAKAVCVYNGKITFSVSIGGPEWVLIEDLKQIVDAFDLVKKFGGLHMAKADIMDLDGFENDSPYWINVKKATNLVEQCKND